MIIRVRFGKEGALRFIGHLDVLRTFQKIFRRAGIPMAYSQGFSPHPIMSFALPLGLGLTSEGEYLDAEIADGLGMGEESPSPASLCSAPSPASGGGQELAADEILTRLRAATSEELPVYAVRILPEKAGNAMASVGRARYRLEIPEACADAAAAAIEKLLAESSHVIDKKTKTQTVSFDLRPCIYELALCRGQAGEGGRFPCPLPEAGEGGTASAVSGEGSLSPTVFLTLSAGSRANVKPELVWEELCREAGLPDGTKPLSVRRLDLLTEEGVSLGMIGEKAENGCQEHGDG